MNTEQQQSHLTSDCVGDASKTDLPNPDTTCLVCEKPHGFRWTDTHGVGVCYHCGAPHTIFHYEGDKRLDKAPALALNDLGLALAKRYWAEKQRMVFPGSYDMGFSGHGGATYSGATNADINAWADWMEAQPEVIAHAAASGAA